MQKSEDYMDGWNCAARGIYIANNRFRSEEAKNGYLDCLRQPQEDRLLYLDMDETKLRSREQDLDDLLRELIPYIKKPTARLKEKMERLLG